MQSPSLPCHPFARQLLVLGLAAQSMVAAAAQSESAVPVYDIQGAGHSSPCNGETLATSGIVTAISDDGFFLQDPQGDGDARTSDAIYVYTKRTPSVSVGDEILISGEVVEFTSGGARSHNLSLTEIAVPDHVEVLSTRNPLPRPVTIGRNGRRPPTETIDDDSFSSFDPDMDGIDFYESLEGMRVTVEDATAVSPINRFGEIFVVCNRGRGATGMHSRGGITVTEGDLNPERIQIDGRLLEDPMPEVSTGDLLGDVTGVMGYSFGSFEVLAAAVPGVTPSGWVPEVTFLTGDETHLTVASYNVQNLDPGDPQEKLRLLGEHIAWNLQSPDIVALQEMQDDSGPKDDGITSADRTAGKLSDAILRAGGPLYEYHDVPPEDNASGGEPGGNIRVGFLVNPDRATLVPGSLQSLEDAVGGAFTNSRTPLEATFLFTEHMFTLINCHLSSRSGSTPLFGSIQPPIEGAARKRKTQAAFLRNRVDTLFERDPPACVILLGDLNDLGFSEPLRILTDGQPGLMDLVTTLPAEERYSHDYLGNSQMLDHILVPAGTAVPSAALDIVHLNTGTHAPASDHDPLIARISVPWTTGGSGSGDPSIRGDHAPVELCQNVPNPFNDATSISYILPRPGFVQLKIFNTAGQLIRTLVDAPRANGPHQLAWEALSEDGRRLGSGVYSYQLAMDRTLVTRRMVLVR